MDEECSFDADAVGNAANGEGFAKASMFSRDNNTFKYLDSFVLAFDNLGMYAYGVAGTEFRNVVSQLFSSSVSIMFTIFSSLFTGHSCRSSLAVDCPDIRRYFTIIPRIPQERIIGEIPYNFLFYHPCFAASSIIFIKTSVDDMLTLEPFFLPSSLSNASIALSPIHAQVFSLLFVGYP